jgi:hypothetical protein
MHKRNKASVPSKKVQQVEKKTDTIKLVGMIEKPKYIQTRTGTPMMTFEIDNKPFKAFNGKVNALAQFYNGRVTVEVVGELSDHKNPKGGPREYELRELQPYLNI